jgi:hypothetical protein
MAGDWNPGLDDPNAMEGMPPMASPLTANGEDPDEAALRYFNAAQRPSAAIDPVRAATGMMEKASASPSAQAAGSAGGAGAAPAPAAATPATPAMNPQEPYSQMSRDALVRAYDVGGQQEQAANVADPYSAKIDQEQQQKLTDEAATPNAADYKPSFGQRVLRGLKSAAVGAVTGGVPGLLTGAIEPGDIRGGTAYGAPTDAYDTAVQAQQKKVAGDTEQIGNMTGSFNRWKDLQTARQKGLADADTSFKNVASDASGAENAETNAAKVPIEQQQADTAATTAKNNSPDAKLQLSQQQLDQRTTFADRMRMPPGMNRTRYILTGEIPTPHEASAEEIALGQADAAFTRENGHPPQTLADFQKVMTAVKGGEGRGGSSQQDANLRRASINAGNNLKNLQALKKTQQLLSQWTPANEQELTDAQKEYTDLQGQLTDAKSPSAADSEGPKAHRFSRSMWSAANPKADVNAAIALAQKQGYEVVP